MKVKVAVFGSPPLIALNNYGLCGRKATRLNSAVLLNHTAESARVRISASKQESVAMNTLCRGAERGLQAMTGCLFDWAGRRGHKHDRSALLGPHPIRK